MKNIVSFEEREKNERNGWEKRKKKLKTEIQNEEEMRQRKAVTKKFL